MATQATGFAILVNWLWRFTASCIILLAVLIILVRQLLLPNINDFSLQIQGQLSQVFGHPVIIKSIAATWQGNGPLIQVNEIAITSTKTREQIKLDKVLISLDVWRSMANGAFVTSDIELQGFHLAIYEDKAFNFSIKGFDAKQTTSNTQLDVSPLMDLILSQQTVVIADSQVDYERYNGNQFTISIPKIRIDNQDDVHTLFADANLVEGDNISLLARFEGDPRLNSSLGSIYAKGDTISLEQLPLYAVSDEIDVNGYLQFEAWFDWQSAEIQNGLIRTLVSDYWWKTADYKSDVINSLKADWEVLKVNSDKWQVASNNFNLGNSSQDLKPKLLLTLSDTDKNILLNLEQLPLLPVWQAISLPYYLGTNQIVKATDKVVGNIQNIRFKYELDSLNEYAFSASINELGVENSWLGLNIQQLNAHISGNHKNGFVEINSPEFKLHWLDGFSEGLSFNQFDTFVNWQVFDQGTQVNIPNYQVAAQAFSLDAAAKLFIDEDIELMVAVNQGKVNVPLMKRWLPLRLFGAEAESFLNDAFLSGEVTDLRVNWQSEFSQFDEHIFDNLIGSANLNKLKIKFEPNWPVAGIQSAKIDLFQDDIFVATTTAQMNGLSQIPANSIVEGYLSDTPSVNIAASTKILPSVAKKWISTTPLKDPLGPVLDFVKVEEKVIPAKFAIHIPLLDVDKLDFDLGLTLNKLGVNLGDNLVNLKKVNGLVDISRSQITTTNLTGYLYADKPSRLQLHGDIRNDSDVNLTISGDGSLSPKAYLDSQSIEFPGLGSEQVFYGLNGTLVSDVNGTKYDIKISSPLTHLSLDLPVPFKKTAPDNWRSIIAVDGDLHKAKLAITLNKDYQYTHVFDLNNGGTWFNGSLLANSTESVDFDDQKTLFVDMNLDTIQFEQWLKWIQSFPSSEQALTELFSMKGGLTIDHFKWENVDFGAVQVNFQPNEKELVLNIVGDNIEGQIHAKIAERMQVRAVLQKLRFPSWPDSWFDVGELAKGKTQLKSEQYSQLTPNQMPLIDLVCKKCMVKNLNLGEVKFATFALENNLAFTFSANNDKEFSGKVNGKWVYLDQQKQFVDSQLQFTIANIDRFLTGLDIQGGIKQSGAILTAAVRHHESLFNFDLQKLSGSAKVDISEGKLLQVGDEEIRILSLLSLQNIIRRLTLDFTNLFEKGFHYDKIDLGMVLHDGVVYARNVRVKGNAADIELFGETNIVKQTFNQRAVVYPKLTESLPVLAGWAIEPTTGLLVMILSEIFAPAIEVMTSVEYGITGTWDKPQTTQISGKKEKVKISEKIIQQERAKHQKKNPQKSKLDKAKKQQGAKKGDSGQGDPAPDGSGKDLNQQQGDGAAMSFSCINVPASAERQALISYDYFKSSKLGLAA